VSHSFSGSKNKASKKQCGNRWQAGFFLFSFFGPENKDYRFLFKIG
jgi:hypothetical protein